jgi:hypothetical protein
MLSQINALRRSSIRIGHRSRADPFATERRCAAARILDLLRRLSELQLRFQGIQPSLET